MARIPSRVVYCGASFADRTPNASRRKSTEATGSAFQFMDSDKQENFERAFSSGFSSCRVTCECGKTYFDDFNRGIDWDGGELEKLKSGAGIPAGGSIGGIEFEGRTYAECCTCWNERAKKIMAFVDGHAVQIARYLTAEKKRKHALAASTPEVKEPAVECRHENLDMDGCCKVCGQGI